MATFVILYDGMSGKNGDGDLREAITALGPHWFGMRSTAIVHSDAYTVDQLRDLLRRHMGDAGKLLLLKSGVEHALLGIDAPDADLLKEML